MNTTGKLFLPTFKTYDHQYIILVFPNVLQAGVFQYYTEICEWKNHDTLYKGTNIYHLSDGTTWTYSITIYINTDMVIKSMERKKEGRRLF